MNICECERRRVQRRTDDSYDKHAVRLLGLTRRCTVTCTTLNKEGMRHARKTTSRQHEWLTRDTVLRHNAEFMQITLSPTASDIIARSAFSWQEHLSMKPQGGGGLYSITCLRNVWGMSQLSTCRVSLGSGTSMTIHLVITSECRYRV